MLVYLAQGNLLIASAALMFAGLVGAGTSVHIYKKLVSEETVKLSHSIDSMIPLCNQSEPLATTNPLLQPLSQSVIQLVEHVNHETIQRSAAQTKYHALIDAMADGLITVSENGTIESINAAGKKLIGQSSKQVTGSHLSGLISDADSVSAKSYLESFIKRSPSDQINLSADILKADGTTFPARLSVSKLVHPEDALFVVVFNDISDIRSMEKNLRSVNRELSRTNERLEKTSITDALTQLYNRRHFDSMFHKELQRATRARTSLSLIIIDIDFFKQYNDIYGHTAGDDCIKQVAGSIKKVFKRSGDLPARYGGEEFAIILPGCDGLELQERAETMRHAVFELEIPHSGSKAHDNLSISIGAVTYKPATQELIAPKPKDLFSEADKALYRAKARGRNQVVFAGQYQPARMSSGLGGIYGQLISR